MICMAELDALAIDQSDCCVRTEGGDGKLFQEISSYLEGCILLTLRFVCLVFPGFPSHNPAAAATRSRLVVRFLRLSDRIKLLVRRPFSRQSVWSRHRFVDCG